MIEADDYKKCKTVEDLIELSIQEAKESDAFNKELDSIDEQLSELGTRRSEVKKSLDESRCVQSSWATFIQRRILEST